MAYQQGGGGGDGGDAVEYLVIGDTLDNIRDDMSDKFVNLAQNMELQLADLRKQLEQEKALTADLRRQLKNSQEQTEEFKQECTEKTNDLNQINAFYQSNAEPSAFENLVNQVQERHNAMNESLQAAQYSFVSIMRICV